MSYTKVKTADEIESMRTAGKMLATVLQHVKKQTVEGMSTKDLDDLAAKKLKTLGGAPSFLGYNGFPNVLCVSVNDEVVHGLPSRDKILEEGDIVSIDFGVTYRGMVTDAAITYTIGAVDPKIKKLIEVTERSMYAGIEMLKDGVRVGDISRAIQRVLDSRGYGVVRDLVGHGVGHRLHEEPDIPNYGLAGTGPTLQAGMTIAIEPMATLGGWQVTMDDDNWTIRTRDHSLAAHFEHTILITESGYEILTVV